MTISDILYAKIPPKPAHVMIRVVYKNVNSNGVFVRSLPVSSSMVIRTVNHPFVHSLKTLHLKKIKGLLI